MDSFISSNDHWVIWTSLVGIAALSLYLEQKYKIFPVAWDDRNILKYIRTYRKLSLNPSSGKRGIF